MNKVKGSCIAKIIAWVLLLASGVTFIVSTVLLGLMEDQNVFTKEYEQACQEKFEEICYDYSVKVLSDMQNGQEEETKQYFADKAFRYGVIETDNLDRIDVSQKKNYLIYNFAEKDFTTKLKEKNVYEFCLELSDDTVIYYNYDSLFSSGYTEYFDYSGKQTLYADQICYDVNKGIFYYRAEGDYYPAESVSIYATVHKEDGSIEEKTLDFQYDADKQMYENLCIEDVKNQYMQEQKDSHTFEKNSDVVLGDDALQILASNEYITFQMFDQTTFDYSQYGDILFDDVRSIRASELTLIDSEAIGESRFPAVTSSYIDENYTLHIELKNDSKTYWVISFVDEEALAQEKQIFLANLGNPGITTKLTALLRASEEDLFVRDEILLDVLYELQGKIYGMIFGTFVLAMICFVFLMCAAGHRRNRQEIVPTFIDRMPLEILCVGVAGACIILVWFGAVLTEVPLSDYSLLYIIFYLGIAVVCILMGFLLSFAVRVKLGKWWRNTIIYWMISKIGKLLFTFWHHRSLLWKTIVVMAVYAVARLFLLLISVTYGSEVTVIIYFLEMVCTCIAVLCVVIQLKKLQEGSRHMAQGDLSAKIDTSKMFWEFKQHGENLNSISEGMSRAVDERMKSERFKTELITNVSHDIKTPLTSIINYVDLLNKTEIQDETQKEYLDVLQRQSARLKKLIEDLIEASKASTGNLPVNIERLEADVFLTQIAGEFEEKLAANELELILHKPEETVYLEADGRHLWRVVDNLMNNICKYAQPHSRVYINLDKSADEITMTFRNISRYPLNISSDELMERFVRGDSSRNTEGNGLGLSIASSLMELMKGKLALYVDGDLFKVVLTFYKM